MASKWELLEEFEAICKDGVTYLVQCVRYQVPFKTFSGETISRPTINYLIEGVVEVVALGNGDYMMKETGTVLRRRRDTPATIT